MNALIETKPCKICGIEKSLSDFYKYSETGTNRERYKGECKHCYKSKKRIKGIGAKIGGKMHYEVIDCFFEWLWESKRPAVSRIVKHISEAEIRNLIKIRNKRGLFNECANGCIDA